MRLRYYYILLYRLSKHCKQAHPQSQLYIMGVWSSGIYILNYNILFYTLTSTVEIDVEQYILFQAQDDFRYISSLSCMAILVRYINIFILLQINVYCIFYFSLLANFCTQRTKTNRVHPAWTFNFFPWPKFFEILLRVEKYIYNTSLVP